MRYLLKNIYAFMPKINIPVKIARGHAFVFIIYTNIVVKIVLKI